MRNVEIKAKITEPSIILYKAKALSDSECKIIRQCDTFFKVAHGRLKLREFEDGTGELLHYVRPNISGPKLCKYEKLPLNTNERDQLKEILAAANGVLGVVKKTRYLYMVGQTRIHIDNVEGLGDFAELEVVLSDKQDVSFGESVAKDLMTALGIKECDLITTAYMDLIINNAAANNKVHP